MSVDRVENGTEAEPTQEKVKTQKRAYDYSVAGLLPASLLVHRSSRQANKNI